MVPRGKTAGNKELKWWQGHFSRNPLATHGPAREQRILSGHHTMASKSNCENCNAAPAAWFCCADGERQETETPFTCVSTYYSATDKKAEDEHLV